MLDPIIISYKLTANVSVTYYIIQQYPINTIYNRKKLTKNVHAPTSLASNIVSAPTVHIEIKTLSAFTFL